jgi:DNA-binding MarR family transcriptional regulator
VTIAEDPASCREKIVSRTAKGERFLAATIAIGAGHIAKIVAQLSDQEIETGPAFLAKVSSITLPPD